MSKKSKQIKRQKEKEQKQQDYQKQLEYKEHLNKMRELCDIDETGRMPIHIFTTEDDFVDDRMPLSRDKQMEIYKNNHIMQKMKSLF